MTSACANGCFATNVSTSLIICTDITPTRCFHTSFQTSVLWYAAT